MEQLNLFQVNLSHIPNVENAVQIPDKIFLIDNFNENKQTKNKGIMCFPVQLKNTIIIMCTAGTAELSINLKPHTLNAGQFATLLAGDFFQWMSKSEDMECGVIVINQDIMSVNFDIKQGMEAAMYIKEHPICRPSYKDFESIISVYNNIKRVLSDTSFMFKEEVARNYLEIFRCYALDRILKSKERIVVEEPKKSKRKEEIFKQFIAAVQDNYTRERNVLFYADKLCVSPKYLSAVVHEVSGKHATHWINEYVILECKAMLKAEGDSVKNVCNRLNFPNQSFFAKYFKQHTGMTPREYKNA